MLKNSHFLVGFCLIILGISPLISTSFLAHNQIEDIEIDTGTDVNDGSLDIITQLEDDEIMFS